MIGRKTFAFAAVTAGAFACCVRPRLLRWGATDEEVAQNYPGAGIVPDGERGATMAITINAPPERVWPWLVQMGWDRGGWYSWDRLDNAGRPSATEIHPEWQQLSGCGVAASIHSSRGPRRTWKACGGSGSTSSSAGEAAS